VRLTWLGHATVVLELDGVRLLTDPLLRGRAGPLRRRGPTPSTDQVAAVDAVLISHLHHDHAELTSIRMLPDLPLLTGQRNAAFLRRRKLSGVDLADDWYDVAGEDGGVVQVRLVRADHHARKMPHRPNDAYGHLVRTPTRRVWLAGDTSIYPEMAGLPDLAGGRIDLAVVPVGGWGPRLSAGHMDPVQAAEACALVGAGAAVPYHWGTFYVPSQHNTPRGWMDRPGPRFEEALAEHAPSCEARLLRPGESTAWETTHEREP
jgi:L-ascorbate metabolism protein UlaG (beta-lactamase superfamily)